MWLLRTHNVRNAEFSPEKTHPSPRAGKSDSVVTLTKPHMDRCEEGGHNQHSSLGLICCCTGADPRIHLSNSITVAPKRCSWRRVKGSNSTLQTFQYRGKCPCQNSTLPEASRYHFPSAPTSLGSQEYHSGFDLPKD